MEMVMNTFADVKAMLDRVPDFKALCALNDAVEEQFASDRQQLVMTDADWHEYTALVARRASQFERDAALSR
jgi:hypothetical protein